MRRHTDTIGCVEDSGEYIAAAAEAPRHRPYWLVIGALMFAVCIACALFQCSRDANPIPNLEPRR